jgi:hypothetical protein
MIKISPFNKRLWLRFLSIFSVISATFSIFSIVIAIPEDKKRIAGIVLICSFVFLYIFLWLYANIMKKITLKVGNSRILVTEGDIFTQNGIKVIGFNEYFDTKVDNIIISDETLNGIFIKKYVSDIAGLDKKIKNDNHLSKMKLSVNDDRSAGKKQQYKLGSIFKYSDDFLLTAFARFDDENRACLDIHDYVNFLLTFWKEIDIFYSGKTIAVTVFGTGITRFNGGIDSTLQDLLDLIIWSFKMSRIKLAYPAELRIIIPKEKCSEVDFYKLKEFE